MENWEGIEGKQCGINWGVVLAFVWRGLENWSVTLGVHCMKCLTNPGQQVDMAPRYFVVTLRMFKTCAVSYHLN